jgi:hypothetical protein
VADWEEDLNQILGVFGEMSDDLALYHDRAGNPLTMGRFIDLNRDLSYKILRKTRVGQYEVSTVWLGITADIYPPPRVFETVIFGPAHPLDFQERYVTNAEAYAGHERVVELLRAAYRRAFPLLLGPGADRPLLPPAV